MEDTRKSLPDMTVTGRTVDEPVMQRIPTGLRGLVAVGENPPRLTPMQAILLAALGGHIRATESGTPVDVRERASIVNEGLREATAKLDAGEDVENLNMGIVAEYQYLKKLGAFKLDMGRKSIRDQIWEATSAQEINLIFASALLEKNSMERRTWKRIEGARRVRLQELASWAAQSRLAEGVR